LKKLENDNNASLCDNIEAIDEELDKFNIEDSFDRIRAKGLKTLKTKRDDSSKVFEVKDRNTDYKLNNTSGILTDRPKKTTKNASCISCFTGKGQT
jgi:hypothetical protein